MYKCHRRRPGNNRFSENFNKWRCAETNSQLTKSFSNQLVYYTSPLAVQTLPITTDFSKFCSGPHITWRGFQWFPSPCPLTPSQALLSHPPTRLSDLPAHITWNTQHMWILITIATEWTKGVSHMVTQRKHTHLSPPGQTLYTHSSPPGQTLHTHSSPPGQTLHCLCSQNLTFTWHFSATNQSNSQTFFARGHGWLSTKLVWIVETRLA